jgi:hypothetical protein
LGKPRWKAGLIALHLGHTQWVVEVTVTAQARSSLQKGTLLGDDFVTVVQTRRQALHNGRAGVKSLIFMHLQ